MHVNVLGVGSPAGDDRVGWLAVEALAQSPLLGCLPSGIQVSTAILDRPGAALLDRLQRARAAVIVDALAGDGPPGSVERLDLDELAIDSGIISAHAFGVASALALGRTLALLPEHLVILGVHVAHIDPGLTPSRAIESAVPALVRRIVEEVCGIADAA